MGKSTRQASNQNGAHHQRRPGTVEVNLRWIKEVEQRLPVLRTFRVMMFILKHDHPEVFELVQGIIRGIDTRQNLIHNRNTLDKPDNETTSS